MLINTITPLETTPPMGYEPDETAQAYQRGLQTGELAAKAQTAEDLEDGLIAMGLSQEEIDASLEAFSQYRGVDHG